MGFCTRKNAKHWMRQHHLTESGVPIRRAGQMVNPDELEVRGEPLPYDYRPLTVLLNKPKDFVCSRVQEHGNKLVYELLPPSFFHRRPTMATCGRLDKYASGLLCLSQDGGIVEGLSKPMRIRTPHLKTLNDYLVTKRELLEERKMLTPERMYGENDEILEELMKQALDSMEDYKAGKRYEIEATLPFTSMHRRLFGSGRLILSGEARSLMPVRMEIDDFNPHKAVLTLYEGRYHQLRRMLASVNNKAEVIHRIGIGSLSIEGLGVGEWRVVTEEEKNQLVEDGIVKELKEKSRNRRQRKNQESNRMSAAWRTETQAADDDTQPLISDPKQRVRTRREAE
eukprot:CAMPEP_0201524092 /NCGR_PEP_ID=MMETSP0161_2-20130828/21108_1 /ASSEMBLY_ACC=CAM_ASM_000251 /TAXON_ID=180227 /ORGANISM="Neoparamoeba aestuarina, Strain SoJaBio B1-5/56/2" /LENGTH=339 /DNA_ID=CAMNT_0047923367 /DNA_START=89 /DNA_END=1108 /DNA_ORIENTATION=-